MEITGLAAVLTILIETIKRTKLIPKRFMPLIAICIGIILSIFYMQPSTGMLAVQSIFWGILFGASSVGLYEFGGKPIKNVYKSFKNVYKLLTKKK